jgi:hypothetical protein
MRDVGRVVMVAALAGLALGGCGTGEVEVTAGGRAVTSTSGAATELTIVLDDGAGSPRTVRLTCDPAGGDHDDPAAACAALDRAGEVNLAPVAKDQMCTQIYGGPQTARITGTWRGKAVDARLSRGDGCEIARWDALVGLLPKV